MKKRLFSLLITLVILLSAIPQIEINAFGQTEDGIRVDYLYADEEKKEILLDEEGRKCLTVIGYVGEKHKITIPSEVEFDEKGVYLPVVSISSYAFANNDVLNKVIIGDNIKEIGENAFSNCSELVSVVLPEGITEIKEETFFNCSLLMKINLPQSLKSIDNNAFEGCTMLYSLKIPSGVEYIGADAFYACESLVLDCSENDYAKEYAENNFLFTSIKESPNYAMLQIVTYSVLGIIIAVIALVVTKIIKKKKEKNKTEKKNEAV